MLRRRRSEWLNERRWTRRKRDEERILLRWCCILMASGGKHFNLIATNNDGWGPWRPATTLATRLTTPCTLNAALDKGSLYPPHHNPPTQDPSWILLSLRCIRIVKRKTQNIHTSEFYPTKRADWVWRLSINHIWISGLFIIENARFNIPFRDGSCKSPSSREIQLCVPPQSSPLPRYTRMLSS